MGIGGAGMSALALIAHRRGVAVSGCDADLSGAGDLLGEGVPVERGHSAGHVQGVRALVVTAAIAPDHPEIAAARAAGIPVVPRKEALAGLIGGRESVALAGTHGKTSTTVMTTLALAAAGRDPTGLAGGRVEQWGGNARPGDDQLFVVEADEYDKAFLALQPTVAVVSNVEADHLECYGSVDALEASFAEFASRARHAFLGADDAGARRVGARVSGAHWFGFEGADVRIGPVARSAAESRTTVSFPDGRSVDLRLAVPGLHNVRNAAGALCAVWALDGNLEGAAAALAEYRGLGRRFERLGEVAGVAVVDDYAHHHSELAATLSATRQAFPGRRLVAVFQPHLFSRTQAYADLMGQALAKADLVVVADIYPAREQPIPGVTGRLVADAARAAGATVLYEPVRAELTRRVAGLVQPGDVVVTMGAGDITRVGRELVEWLKAA